MPIILPQLPESLFSSYDPKYVPGYTAYTPKLRSEQGYFHPSSGKYFYTQRNHTYDGNPRTSSAIKVIEEIKYDLSTPAKFTLPEKDRWASIREGSLRERSKHNGRNEQTGEVPGHPSYRNENLKNIFKEDLIGSNPSTKLSHTNEYLQRRQGKLIYRANSGLLPNYSGYTPGQMFSIGSTWGKSSVNAIGKLHEQRFQWTSLF
ncbi:uncharacterized protein LOC122931623 isoform X2 [Bufo gargarizans]|uniref:uncharacterized protein LOC122931623 isoform X2 n=1 Tax=Bufo gargarizans TaxID=30331 RepID=UPI001CF1D8EB|nr:uncharacterized protein LOC122931623 isoform X2 [Bufo gargarizans]